MTRKLARLSFLLLLAALVVSQPSFSQDKQDKDKKTSNKKNSDVDKIGERDINKRSINFTSLEKEQQLGRELSDQVERQVKLVNDSIVNEYVNRVGQNLVRNS